MTNRQLTAFAKQTANPDELLAEKQMIEQRLEQLGYDGDCAYEKAMVAFYQRRLAMFENLIQQTA